MTFYLYQGRAKEKEPPRWLSPAERFKKSRVSLLPSATCGQEKSLRSLVFGQLFVLKVGRGQQPE
jgi:hypothetical protein